MEAFSQDFNCAKGSAMNPKKKCQVNEILEEVDKYFAGLVSKSREGVIYIFEKRRKSSAIGSIIE